MAMQTALKALQRSNSVLVVSQRSLAGWNGKPGTSTAADHDRKGIHLTSKQAYPQVAPLPLPENIDPNETIQFSPHRTREMSQALISVSLDAACSIHTVNRDVPTTVDYVKDSHEGFYDAHGTVNLNCMMQTSVPEPFGGGHKFTHLNMPGGQWSQNGKFMAQDLQSSHYTNLRQQVRQDWDKKGPYVVPNRAFHHQLLHCLPAPTTTNTKRNYSTQVGHDKESKQAEEAKAPPPTESKKAKLKQAFKDYGATIVVFHVGISLASLGMFYTLVSSGLDVVAIVNYFNMGDSVLASKVGTGASTFVVAYAVHKVFAPVRISITLGATPFLVRMMRKRGILKK